MPHFTPDRVSLDRIRPAGIFVNRSNLIRLPCGRVRRWPGSTRVSWFDSDPKFVVPPSGGRGSISKPLPPEGGTTNSFSEDAVMSHFHRRQILQSGVAALANYVIGAPLSNEAQTETR